MKDPKIGIALGSGGARGFAHLGVLKILEQEGIPIHFLAGSSMGSIIACFYSAGHSMERLYSLSKAFRRKYYLDFTVPKMGFIAGKRIKEFIRLFTHHMNLEDLPIPVAVVATDIKTGEKVIFKQGPIAEAVRASIAIPGIFVPERYQGRLLVDGGVVDRVPVSVVKEMGADLVIGVDVSSVKMNEDVTTIYDVIMQSYDIMQMEIGRHREKTSDLMIKPNVEMYSGRAFTNIEEIINIGEEAARQQLPNLMELIDRWRKRHV
ncbi:MAG TPA: patatin-like phospholipase family protein [Bacillus sp. (in: firmicutes)]|uniref:patatin-like phospholipase family protein n=1 Tax=Bacillus litorisediminis TaxID=2922713 RepID=UPI001FABD730|nr:patatin-like phospholipase family protein [Bacillus litorisediminis]HWO74814.1 patatin-like phospholipase family protein [Bacillus sp. (in: firmicutes)]